jgi:hypothetical protein
MATTINASTSAGLVSTADTSGVLQLQTAGTTALTISTAQLATLAGGLNFSTLDAGITFNKTSALTNSTLNDYEVGTWTPTVTSGATGISYTSQTGKYTKVGNVVNIVLKIQMSAATAAASQIIFGGLPFAAAIGLDYAVNFAYNSGFNTNSSDTYDLSQSTISVYQNTGSARNGNSSGVTLTGLIYMSAFYLTT